MADGWSTIGETSVLLGIALGFSWAALSTGLRHRRFLRAGVRPVGQNRWFLLNFVGMASQLTLLIALGLLALETNMPSPLLWLLLATAFLAFGAALSIATVATPAGTPAAKPQHEPLVEPPAPTPLRKSA
jgi:hypothetical protein